jgi:tRNA-2-methylthio-N6-dimethylallyladenosine synthase
MYDTDPQIKFPVRNIDEQRQGEPLVREEEHANPEAKKYYIESYGCQMNFSDSEIVASILSEAGMHHTPRYEEADAIFINTCAIRDNAEQRVRNRLDQFNALKKNKPALMVGVLGCMAERLKEQLLEEEKIVDMVVGPDAYRDLPKLVEAANTGEKAVNTILSKEETYGDINPVRLQSNGVSAFISIMRGCDNMCSFCVVPFTRGRERSRNPDSIVAEAQQLFDQGYREVTLLGQNVDSYLWFGGGAKKDFSKLTTEEKESSVNFAQLLERVAQVHPELRVRFSTSNPQDMTEDVVQTMARYDNICNYIHLPVQSGNTRVLEMMNRGYSREWYLNRIHMIRRIIPDCGISSDIIAGFCSETEEEHQDTLTLMDAVKYDMNYLFYYSGRPGALAARKYEDDVPLATKKRRLSEIIRLQQQHSFERNRDDIGSTFNVLVEGNSKKSDQELCGRNDQNKMIVFPKNGQNIQPGMYVNVKVHDCTSATLLGQMVSV